MDVLVAQGTSDLWLALTATTKFIFRPAALWSRRELRLDLDMCA
jgi:hypothetical protein